MNRRLFVCALTLALAAGTTLAAETLKSGPQVGEDVPGPFHPLNVNGAKAGQKNCLYCENGSNPVAMVFARDVSPALTQLIQKLDRATAKLSACSMGSFVVFLNDDEGLTPRLKELAEKENLKHTVLSIDNQGGPKSYHIAKDADVTVVLYKDRKVAANYAFKTGEMKDTDVTKIVAALPKILPEK